MRAWLLLCAFFLCVALSLCKVLNPSVQYNSHDEAVNSNSLTVDKIVPIDGSMKVLEHDALNKEFLVKYETVLYKEEKGHRTVEIIYAQNDLGQEELMDCFLIGDEDVVQRLLVDIPAEHVKTVDKKAMTKLVDACSEFLFKEFEEGRLHMHTKTQIGDDSSLNRGFFDGLFIFPGTKWCGAGSVASDYEDLGSAVEADKCCRTHDHCNDSIPSRGEKYGLKNRALYTSSHCDCDRTFQQCLLKANVNVANTIGSVYYNLLQTKCFEINYPTKKCLKYSGWIPLIHWSCQEYEFDTTKNKIWQFFDAKKYEAPENFLNLQLNQRQ